MRVLFIQGGFGTGGAEKIVAMIANHRAAHGDQVEVAGMRAPRDGSYYRYSPDVTLHVLEPNVPASEPVSQIKRLKMLRKLIRDRKPDVVVSFLTKINVLTLTAGLGTGIPIVISERNNPRAQNNHPLWHTASMTLSRRATSVVTLTERGRDQLPAKVRHRTRVIPNPCVPIEGARAQINGAASQLVAVGRLDWQKGFDLLLHAVARLRDSHPTLSLTIFGEGPERKALEGLRADLGLEATVAMPGTTQRHGAWVSEADILVVTSRYEGFCNVVAEATLSGVPIISFDCEFGPREMIRHEVNGLLVQTGDIDGMADNLSRLINDTQLRARMSAASYLNVEYLDPDRILKSWDAVINDAVEV
ncbi:glycosyltransferase family 4 protein [uncultured Aliiroseovarius sp.]|uniref:glycosyltransferase family 4 protein n=1 Tax=uncultured Aliiroseovarius sp. TaxID=1658783 RepID=UPI002614C4B4|nr:glycosyltransferase family 4 protein [uncultured Aliiroseovarius sp.]